MLARSQLLCTGLPDELRQRAIAALASLVRRRRRLRRDALSVGLASASGWVTALVLLGSRRPGAAAIPAAILSVLATAGVVLAARDHARARRLSPLIATLARLLATFV